MKERIVIYVDNQDRCDAEDLIYRYCGKTTGGHFSALLRELLKTFLTLPDDTKKAVILKCNKQARGEK